VAPSGKPKKKAGGQYHFVLKAANGEIVATSEYTTKAAAQNGIESVKSTAKPGRPDGAKPRISDRD
jgi:uncharacterized protein YegP (UPF0339 family)